jgi:2-polyprenyl-3-methyl-5-hydroxy-6-metoxy-1,4-benzoquinol methylase
VTSVGTELQSCVVCGGTLELASQKDGFDLVSCASCGMLMRRRLPAREELEEIYAPEYFTYRAEDPLDGYANYLGDAERHREAARRRLSLIDRFTPSRGRLLDVGAAAGFFVDEAIRAGWDAEGVDIARHIVEWGRRELGVPLRVGEVSAVEGQGAFTAVTMWDYIEHSLDPVGDLARSNELLAPDGVLALSTGDLDSVAARLFRSRWHLLTPRHHNFFFGARTLVRLLEQSGFDVAWLGHPGSRYSLAHLAYKFDRGARTAVTAAAARRIASSRLGGYSVPLSLFDIVSVVARKARQTPRVQAH